MDKVQAWQPDMGTQSGTGAEPAQTAAKWVPDRSTAVGGAL